MLGVSSDVLVRDGIELLIVVAVGGMVFSAIRRLRRGEIAVYRCRACGRPTSRAFPKCRRCGADLPDAAM
ncbi:MAG TPA: hypothetical protein VFV35_04830 [Acidimicrobiales bacterium]|nr:hypothetical protein [Acidimicrobiales bacterium]